MPYTKNADSKPAEISVPQLSVSGYSNNGDSFQVMIVKPMHHDGVYQVFKAAASHGYASAPELSYVEAPKLPQVLKAVQMQMLGVLNSRDPVVQVNGTGEFAPIATKLQELAQAQSQDM